MSYIKRDFLLTNPTAQTLYYDYAKDMPIFDYHCHLPEKQILENKPFSDIYEIWLAGDHYKWRLMRNYGVDERLYLREENFTDEPANKQYVRWIIGTCRAALQDACKRGSPTYRDYVAYYDHTYKHVPFWVLIRMLSFGNTSKFLALLKRDDGRTVAKAYGVTFETLCDLVEYVVCFRNIAAHGERVYCAHLAAVTLDSLPQKHMT